MSTKRPSHLNAAGEVHMVNVSDKPATDRRAVAEGRIFAPPGVLSAVMEGSVPKGDVLAVARVAAVLACKRTSDLIPLCHPLPLSGVEVRLDVEAKAIRVTVEVATTAPTGVEMEALTGVSVALLTLYDMLKSLDRGLSLSDIRLLSKSGGKSGTYLAPETKSGM